MKRNISIVVPIVESKPDTESTEVQSGEPEKKVIKVSELTAKDRLEMRAKKFAGQVSVEAPSDRLQARAARFGTAAPASDKPTAVKSSESLEKLKKRAERFGIAVPEVKESENQEKLQKRQERFGASDKAKITAPSASSSEYAEKALKRLERFKQAA